MLPTFRDSITLKLWPGWGLGNRLGRRVSFFGLLLLLLLLWLWLWLLLLLLPSQVDLKTSKEPVCRGFDFKQDTCNAHSGRARTWHTLLQTNTCEVDGFATPDRPTNGYKRTPDLIKCSADEEMDGEPDMNKLKADLGPDAEVVAGSAADCRAICHRSSEMHPTTRGSISQADPKGTETPYHLREKRIQVGECWFHASSRMALGGGCKWPTNIAARIPTQAILFCSNKL